jgi:F0F1-type ATP synthase membrane subunit c/vacuolar-type H+-ATPase subunit K
MIAEPSIPQTRDLVAPPTSTAEEDRGTAGQRAVNLLWEHTQRQIALAVIGAALMVGMALAVFGRWIGSPDIQLAAVVFLFGVANLVTGFYFGRTNHTRVGGVAQRER